MAGAKTSFEFPMPPGAARGAMIAPRHLILAVAFGVACAGVRASSPDMPAGTAPARAGAISGIVFNHQGVRLPGQIVAVGGRRTTSDGEGRFSLADVPATYDLMVAKPDGDLVTIYQGISRRDPRVVHTALHEPPPGHRAQIVGSLAGGEWAGTSALITFTSARARPVTSPVSVRRKAGAGRGEYGPIIVPWSGADTIEVKVVALLRNTPETPGAQPTALSAWFATKSLTLRAGETATVDLEPGKVPVVRRRFPRIVKQSETHPYHDILAYSENYEIPGIGRVFFEQSGGTQSESPAHFPKDLTTWDKEVADLSAFGLRLCGQAEEYDPWLHASTRLCGFALDEARTMTLPAPPSFSAPVRGTKATEGMKLAWSAVPRAVYRVGLDPSRPDGDSFNPKIEISETNPRMVVFTTQTTVSWPDLAGLGIPWQQKRIGHVASLAVMGPFLSMDEMVAPGLETVTPRERWESESDCLNLVIPSDGGSVDVPADEQRICTPEFFRTDM
jgi:hypothetical protein